MASGIELDETDDELIARAALPGLDRKDFAVEVTENRLIIRGVKRASSTRQGQGFSGFEQRAATFAEAVELPYEIDRDRVTAKYKNGLLTVTLPKTEQARKKRIKITVA
jgi:HSP20 family protein